MIVNNLTVKSDSINALFNHLRFNRLTVSDIYRKFVLLKLFRLR